VWLFGAEGKGDTDWCYTWAWVRRVCSLKEDPAVLHSKNKDGWQPLHQAAYR